VSGFLHLHIVEAQINQEQHKTIMDSVRFLSWMSGLEGNDIFMLNVAPGHENRTVALFLEEYSVEHFYSKVTARI